MDEKKQCLILGFFNVLYGIVLLLSTLLIYLTKNTYFTEYQYYNILKDFIISVFLLIVGIVGIKMKKYRIFLIASIITGFIGYVFYFIG